MLILTRRVGEAVVIGDDDTWPVDRCVVCGHTRDCHADRPTPTATASGTQRANSNTDSN